MQISSDKFRSHLWKLANTLVLTLSLCGGCGTWLKNPKRPTTGTPPATMGLRTIGEVTSTAIGPKDIAATDATGQTVGHLTLTTAKMVLSEVSLKSGVGDSQVGGVFAGPYVADLLTGAVAPTIADVVVSPGSYEAIQVTLTRLALNDSAQPPELAGASLLLAGEYVASDGHRRPFSLVLDFDDEFDVPLVPASTGTTSLTIAVGERLALVLAFRLEEWLAKAGHDLEVLPGNAIELNGAATGAAKDVLEHIRRNIEASAGFRRDDGN